MRSKMLSVLACGLFVALVACATLTGPAYGKTIELTYATFFPATHGHAILMAEWAKEVEKRTNGAVKIKMFMGGTLTPGDQCYDGVAKGISDIGNSVMSYTKGKFPLIEVVDLPLGIKSGLQASRLVNAVYKKFKPKEFGEVQVMYLHAHGPGLLHTKAAPVSKLEDLKGLKIRSSGTSAKVVKALGATPVAMPQPETYEALNKGVVDGLVSPIETMKGFKFAEVVKYTTMNTNSAYSMGFFVVMNKKKWESLPKDVQATIEKINEEWIEKTGNAWDAMEKEGVEYSKAKGIKVIELSKDEDARWVAAVQPVLAEFVKETKGKGLPGDEAVKFCQEWLKTNK